MNSILLCFPTATINEIYLVVAAFPMKPIKIGNRPIVACVCVIEFTCESYTDAHTDNSDNTSNSSIQFPLFK